MEHVGYCCVQLHRSSSDSPRPELACFSPFLHQIGDFLRLDLWSFEKWIYIIIIYFCLWTPQIWEFYINHGIKLLKSGWKKKRLGRTGVAMGLCTLTTDLLLLFWLYLFFSPAGSHGVTVVTCFEAFIRNLVILDLGCFQLLFCLQPIKSHTKLSHLIIMIAFATHYTIKYVNIII